MLHRGPQFNDDKTIGKKPIPSTNPSLLLSGRWARRARKVSAANILNPACRLFSDGAIVSFITYLINNMISYNTFRRLRRHTHLRKGCFAMAKQVAQRLHDANRRFGSCTPVRAGSKDAPDLYSGPALRTSSTPLSRKPGDGNPLDA